MDIRLIQLQKHGDERGALVALEETRNVPFSIKRIYYLFATKPEVRRGFHAHKKLKQLVIAVRGSCRFLLDDGNEKIELLLDNPAQGILLESMVWREMYDFSNKLFASHIMRVRFSGYYYLNRLILVVKKPY